MRKLIILAFLVLLGILVGPQAQAGGKPKHKISAQEMGTIGSGVAALLGVGGYLVLRRRKSA